MSAFVKKHPAISLLVLAMIFGITPVLIVIEGRTGGLRELLGRGLIWRVGIQWWILSLFFMVVPAVASLYLYHLLDGPAVDWSGLQPLYIDVYRGHFGGILTVMAVSVLITAIIVVIAGANDLSRIFKRNVLEIEKG